MAFPYMKGPDTETAAKTAPRPTEYGSDGEPIVKTEEPTVSKVAYKGEKKSDVDLKKAGHPETVKNAYDMVDNLRKTIKKNSEDPTAQEALGGEGNISGALAAVASLFQQAQQRVENQKQAKKEVLESYLRKYYKEATGKEALDLFGKETPDYQAWRTAYLELNNLTDHYDV